MSPETATNIAFGSVMILIGLLELWLVKWSTDKLAKAHQGAETGILNAGTPGVRTDDNFVLPRASSMEHNAQFDTFLAGGAVEAGLIMVQTGTTPQVPCDSEPAKAINVKVEA